MKKLTLSALLGATLLCATAAQAHIVGLGWTFQANGDVTFDALHWHSAQSSARGALIVDGVSYNFTSFTNDTTSMTGLDGALVNSTYSSYDGAGTLSAIRPENDWLHVTISGLSAGTHNITADYGPGGLTSWTLDGGVTTTPIVTPPPTSNVSEPASIALLGLGLIGLGFTRRRKTLVAA